MVIKETCNKCGSEVIEQAKKEAVQVDLGNTII